jgi:NAD(P)-dependent dehydrogenase (short-subunit alcohol dehydrogenase family)
MQFDYKDQVVLITGAAGGFGRLAAAEFARAGAKLILCDLDKSKLKEVSAAMRDADVIIEAGDVSEEDTHRRLVARALEAYGRLDVAINNAGVAHAFTKITETDNSTMQQMLAVNVFGVFLAMKHQLPVMERQNAGAILNVSSVAGVVGAPLLAAYSAAKHGVIGLTKSAGGEYARKGIRINAICPAFAETHMLTGMLDQMRGGAEAASQRIISNMPMRRFARPEEIVQAMLWICSRENSFMTGHALVLDGGLSAV